MVSASRTFWYHLTNAWWNNVIWSSPPVTVSRKSYLRQNGLSGWRCNFVRNGFLSIHLTFSISGMAVSIVSPMAACIAVCSHSSWIWCHSFGSTSQTGSTSFSERSSSLWSSSCSWSSSSLWQSWLLLSCSLGVSSFPYSVSRSSELLSFCKSDGSPIHSMGHQYIVSVTNT